MLQSFVAGKNWKEGVCLAVLLKPLISFEELGCSEGKGTRFPRSAGQLAAGEECEMGG